MRLLTDKSTCGCGSKIPLGLSPKIIAEITEESIEKVFSKLKKSLHEKVRADLKLGVSEYIEDLKELLSNYFCEKDIEFSVAKIN